LSVEGNGVVQGGETHGGVEVRRTVPKVGLVSQRSDSGSTEAVRIGLRPRSSSTGSLVLPCTDARSDPADELARSRLLPRTGPSGGIRRPSDPRFTGPISRLSSRWSAESCLWSHTG